MDLSAAASTPPPPAPGEATHRVLALANSRTTVSAEPLDQLDSPESATAWLVQQGLAPADGKLGDPCAIRLRFLREDVRELLGARATGSQPRSTAVEALNTVLAKAPAASLLSWDPDAGPRRIEPFDPDRLVDTAIARLAADAVDLLTGPDAGTLAACGAPGCIRFFLRTHAARQWCGTRCGDRVRAARLYARRTGRSTAED